MFSPKLELYFYYFNLFFAQVFGIVDDSIYIGKTKGYNMNTELIFLKSNDPELVKAWENFPDKVMENKVYGEVLQYMGTVLEDGAIRHEFRHRAIPKTNERKYWHIPASKNFTPILFMAIKNS
jgi:hypothetical protein